MGALTYLLATAVGLILLTAGLAKLLSPAESVEAMVVFGLRIGFRAKLASIALVVLEILVGLALVLAPSESIPLNLAGSLFLAYGVAMSRVLRRGDGGQCGCLGKFLAVTIDWSAAAINFAIGLVVIGLAQTDMSTESFSRGSKGVLVATAILVSILYWLSSYARSVSRMMDEHMKAAEA